MQGRCGRRCSHLCLPPATCSALGPFKFKSSQPHPAPSSLTQLLQIWNYQQTSTMVQGWQFGDPTGSVSSRASSSASASSDGGAANWVV